MLTVWSGTKKENVKKIKILQNKCLRNLFYNKYRIGNISTEDLYKEHNILEFEKVIELEMNTNIYKILNNKLKCDIHFEFKNNIHSYQTRQSRSLHKIKSKNKYGTLSFTNRSINSFNKISTPIKKLKNVNTLKKKLKNILLNEQIISSINKKPKKRRV